MRINNDINGIVYVKLIEYVSKKCDAVMFVIRRDKFRNNETDLRTLSKTEQAIEKQIGKSFLKKRTNARWVFSQVGDPDPYDDDRFGIYFYKFSNEVKHYLLSNTDLREWQNPEYPEDLSFFKDGYCWLYSVGHEDMCYIYCKNEEEYEYLKSIGIEFVENKFIQTPEEKLYFEEYGKN